MYSGDKILPFLTEMKWLGFAICLLLCTSTFLKPILSRWCSSIPYKVILMDENLEMLYVIVSKYLLQTQTDCNDCNLCHCIEIELVGFYYIFPRFLEVLLQISWQILFIAEFLQNYADTIMQTSLFIIKWFVYFSMQHNIINTFLQTRICTFVWVLNNLPKPTMQKNCVT